jgi:hypothetical protein
LHDLTQPSRPSQILLSLKHTKPGLPASFENSNVPNAFSSLRFLSMNAGSLAARPLLGMCFNHDDPLDYSPWRDWPLVGSFPGFVYGSSYGRRMVVSCLELVWQVAASLLLCQVLFSGEASLGTILLKEANGQ